MKPLADMTHDELLRVPPEVWEKLAGVIPTVLVRADGTMTKVS